MKLYTNKNEDELHTGFSFIGLLCGLIVAAFALVSVDCVKKINFEDSYKQGYADGYQARINYERSW